MEEVGARANGCKSGREVAGGAVADLPSPIETMSHELMCGVAGWLDDGDRLALARTSRRWRAVVLVVGFQKLYITTQEQAEAVMEMVKSGLRLCNTSLSVHQCVDEWEHLNKFLGTLGGIRSINLSYLNNVSDESVKALAGVHTINLSGCTQLSDEAVKALAGVHTIGMAHCKQLSDDAIKSLAGVHTINLVRCTQLSDEACTQLSDAAVKALAGVHTINLGYCRQLSDEARSYRTKQQLNQSSCWSSHN
eukprot:TRINITY_DN399_c0_g1_i7.p1 TRINITY_DN399_c0_g1~~TRINITY_DN399_c0_g1_i7.p1  ORF type:complete len:250 (-),score=37.89 TRINITY_DN399_c0_g1_i7:203-952(-)